MRVCVLSPWPETDPAAVRGAPDQAYLIWAMRARGWDVRLVKPLILRLPGVLRLVFLGLEIFLNALFIPLAVLSLPRPRLIVVMDGKLVPGALVASWLSGARLAKFQHGIKDFALRRAGFLWNPDVLLNYLSPGLLFAVEDGSGAWGLLDKLKVRKALRLSQAKPGWKPRQDKPRVFAFVGRLHRIKGAQVFLRVAERVRELCPGAGCLVVGDGPLAPRFRARPWIRSVGEVRHPEVQDRLNRAKVLCSTCPYGNFTLPVLEAMSLGAVPVVFGVGDTRQLLGPGGIVVPPGDTETMAREVARLLEDEAWFRKMSQRALEKAREYPTWTERTKMILEALEALCSGH